MFRAVDEKGSELARSESFADLVRALPDLPVVRVFDAEGELVGELRDHEHPPPPEDT